MANLESESALKRLKLRVLEDIDKPTLTPVTKKPKTQSGSGSVNNNKTKVVEEPPKKTYPQVTFDSKSVIPWKLRQRCLEKLVDAYSLVYENNHALVNQKSIENEKQIHDTTNQRDIYVNEISHRLTALKKEKEKPKETSLQKDQKPDFPQDITFSTLKTLCHSSNQLIENGYPIMLENKDIEKTSLQRIQNCSRCGKLYDIHDLGPSNPKYKEMCTYHSGKPLRERGSDQKIYNCCRRWLGTEGCTVGPHVFEKKTFEELLAIEGIDIVKTNPCPENLERPTSSKVMALDCEMCYTLGGLELVRLTLINSRDEIIIDELVRPDYDIVDYNTSFSGITQEKIDSAKLNFKEAQQLFLNHVYEDTILVGHSLESDLKVLRIQHETILDTSILFPHQHATKTLPIKYSLKVLTQNHLKRTIQSNVEGHDSLEDAKASLHLVYLKAKEVQEDLRLKNFELPRFQNTKAKSGSLFIR